jgi:uncharacterized protein (PEP-CTERM system associated)
VDPINFNNDNGQQSFSLRVLPEFRRHLNRYADVVSRNAVDVVTYSGGDSDSSKSINVNLSLVSGRYFGRTDWSVDTNYRETRYADRTDTNKNVGGTVGYRIDRKWRVFGSTGYENNDVQTDRNDASGVTWDVGADWTPNSRTSVSAKYGSRYFGDSWSGGVSHRSKRTRLGLDFSRSVDNRRNQQLVDSFFFLVDEDGNVVTDPVTGAPIIANIPQLNETDEDYINSQLRGILTVTGRRTTASVTGSIAKRDYEVSGNGEDSYDLSARLTRQLGSGYSGSLGASLRHTERDSGADSDSYDVSFSLSKTFSRRTSASLTYSYRDDNDDESIGDYTERRLGLTLRANLL